MPPKTPFDLKFTSREVTPLGGLALFKRMLDAMGFKEAVGSWDLPQPGSNRGYRPEQLIEQMIVSIWCGAARFAHADITRLLIRPDEVSSRIPNSTVLEIANHTLR
jgi:hypothetical protein